MVLKDVWYFIKILWKLRMVEKKLKKNRVIIYREFIYIYCRYDKSR